MYKYVFMGGIAVLLSACAPVPVLCDREAQLWDKFNTVEDDCARVLRPMMRPEVIAASVPVRNGSEGPGDEAVGPKPGFDDPSPTNPEKGPQKPSQGNNGWGNGDQDAPGGSGPNNSAENNTKGKTDPRGGPKT